MEARAFLGSISFFAEVLGDGELDELAAGARSLAFDSGATIIREGDPGDSMFVIAEGTVAISFNHTEGHRHVATLRAGDTVGEMSLMSGAPRAATVTAESPVVMIEIDRSAVRPLLAANPALFDRFADMLQKRRTDLDALYGPGVWPFAAPRDDDLAVIIRTYFSDAPKGGAT